MNDSQGELLTTITQILVRMVILAVKYVIYINVRVGLHLRFKVGL